MLEKLVHQESNGLRDEINKSISRIKKTTPIIALYSEHKDPISGEVERDVYSLVSFQDYTAVIIGDPLRDIDNYPKKIFIIHYDGKIENPYTQQDTSQKDLEYLSKILEGTIGVF